MKIITEQNISYIEPAAITIGTFDGVHLGHRKVLKQLRLNAKRIGAHSVVISFKNHPRKVINPDYDIKFLNTLDEKISLIGKQGIDYIFLIEFNKKMANLSAGEFIEYLRQFITIKLLVVGYDNRFGKNRESNFQIINELSKKYNFDVVYVYPLYINSENISSTKIREALQNGDIAKANIYLGYKYFIKGEVIEGLKIGTKIGFPTANIKVPAEKLLPKFGVYATITEIDGVPYWSMTNIGYKPTISREFEPTVETHIFNFSEKIYGKKITIKFFRYIRDEKRFVSIEQLRVQLQRDKEEVMQVLINS